MKNLVGKKVIVRGDRSGVQYGEVISIENNVISLKNSRRIWYWAGAASLSELAEKGVKFPKNCKFSVTNTKSHYIFDVIEVIECTIEAVENIEAVPVWTC